MEGIIGAIFSSMITFLTKIFLSKRTERPKVRMEFELYDGFGEPFPEVELIISLTGTTSDIIAYNKIVVSPGYEIAHVNYFNNAQRYKGTMGSLEERPPEDWEFRSSLPVNLVVSPDRDSILELWLRKSPFISRERLKILFCSERKYMSQNAYIDSSAIPNPIKPSRFNDSSTNTVN